MITEVRKGLGWKHNLYAFFRAENDHRLFLPRLIAYLDYVLFGYLNFKNYILIATINLVLVTGFIYQLFRQTKLPFYYFLPIPFFIFQPQYHEVSFWALTGLQHTFLLLLLSVCLTLLKKPASSLRLGLAIGLAGLATFTHGNGILVFATGGYFLLIERHYKTVVIWLLAMLAALGFYLIGYTPGSGVRSSVNWAYLPASFFAKIGAIFSVWHQLSFAGPIIWGLLISGMVIPAMISRLVDSVKNPHSRHPLTNPLYAYFCFIFLTIALITVFRAGSEIILENRFKVYAAFSSVFFYLFLLLRFDDWRKPILVSFGGFAALFYLNSFYHYTPEVADKYSRAVADTYNWPQNQTELCNFYPIDNSLHFLLPAYREGYWRVPNVLGNVDQLVDRALHPSFKSFPFLTQYFLHPAGGHPQLFIEINQFPFQRRSLSDNLFIILRDEGQQKTYLTGTVPKVAGWRRLLTEGSYFGPGFSTTIPLEAMQAGKYTLGSMLIRANRQPEIIMTHQTVSVKQ
ncbi:hypothetical protein [Larkinella ripae]